MKKTAKFFENLTKRNENYIERDPTIALSFNSGARVDVIGYTRKKFKVEFWDSTTGNLDFSTTLGAGYFASPSRKYVVMWNVKVLDENDEVVKQHQVDFKGKTVHISLESTSLGDNLAWMSQAVRFSELNECKLILTTFHNSLFDKEKYSNVTFNEPGTGLPPYDYSYSIGYFYDNGNAKFNRTPIDPRTSPLGKVPCDILQIPYVETRPQLLSKDMSRPIPEKYVCIATSSTAGAKFWHRTNGWQDVVNFLNSEGYKVALIHKERNELTNVIDWTGDRPLADRMNQLRHCEFFIGIGSGLSWLAWGMKKPVVLISGFSDEFAEFQLDCTRIINKKVCNSCWNDTNHEFDKGDWWWCPRLKGTPRYFECTREITSEEVINRIREMVK